MDLEHEARVAIVTGASKGIGLAATEALLEAGACVVAVSRGSSPELDALQGDIRHVAADLTDAEALGRIVQSTLAGLGRLDVLINNAGGSPPGVTLPEFGFLGADDAEWDAVIGFNLLSVVRMCRAALPALVDVGGTIVNVTSAHARQPSAVNVHYGAAKAGVWNLTGALSEEFGPQGVASTACARDRCSRRGGPMRAAPPRCSPTRSAVTATACLGPSGQR